MKNDCKSLRERHKTMFFDTLEQFFKYIETLEDESQQELLLLDFTGSTNYQNTYKIVCP